MKLLNFFKRYSFAFFIILITSYICYKNYTPDTFLTGWDTLHPEFNFSLYWKRILGSVWQEHQGLGAVASQAHASEIIRIVILQLINFFLKVNQIRYFYTFLMLVIGPLGVYFFLVYLFGKKDQGIICNVAAFLGSLFYLLNLGTLQHFYVPLEMFLTQFGFIGWIFLFGTKYFDEGKRRQLFGFLLFSILIIPQAHTPTLFYAYFLVLSIYFGVLSKSKNSFKRTLKILFLTLLINSFWLFPNIYYGVTRGSEVSQSKIHHLFTEEAFLANRKFGNIKDIALLRNFLFDWGEHVGEGLYGQLLDEWQIHLKNLFVSEVGYVFFGLVFLGVVLSFIRKNEYGKSILVVGLICTFFIFGTNPPLGFVFEFFQRHIPLFEEVFRFPFTKFSMVLALCYSFFFGYFFFHIFKGLFSLYSSRFSKFGTTFLIAFSVLLTLYFYARPMFFGSLISPTMRLEIPDRYFEMFDYFESQEEYGRVINLPVHSYWGWAYYNWGEDQLGYQGAGFLWFGVKQPLLNREFDRWNLKNEQAYRELSHAVYAEDLSLVENTLKKYKIKWIILDESVIAPGSDETLLFYSQIESLFTSSDNFILEKDFGEGLYVYSYNSDYTKAEFFESYGVVGNRVFKEYLDPIYKQLGTYIVSGEDRYFFVGISQLDENIDPGIISSNEQEIIFKIDTPVPIENTNNVVLDIFSKYENSILHIKLTSDISGVDETIKFPADSKINYILIIGDEPFYIKIEPKVSNEFNRVGSINVGVDKSLQLELYELVNKGTMSELNYYPNLEACSKVDSDSSYSLERLENGFSLSAENILACVTTPLNNFINTSTPSRLLSFSYEGNVREEDICIFSSTKGSCIDFLLGKENRVFGIIEGNISDYFIRFYSDGVGEQNSVKTIFQNVSVEFMSKVSSELVAINYSNETNQTVNELRFPKKISLSSYVSNLKGNPRSCAYDLDDSEGYSIKKEGNSVVYSSFSVSLCDSFAFPTALHDTGYVLEVRSRNIAGVPLRICLTNEYSKRCDIDVSLPKSSNLESYYYLIPQMGRGKGFTVNISNLVFGNSTSINELEYISLVPVSMDTLFSAHSPFEELMNKDGEKLYVFYEAYDPGWVALCGRKLCDADHVEVNNWANGWVFKNEVPNNVKILFWPQYLQYLGYLLFGLGLFIVVTAKSKTRENPVPRASHSIDKT